MITHLGISNVGPASCMSLDFGPRLNLFTGDNGLGKSFLLDIIWWAMTRHWPAELNPKLTAGKMALPTDKTRKAEIDFSFSVASKAMQSKSQFMPRLQSWTLNSRKREYDDVLDPFSIEDGWFHLELVTGHIFPNQELPDEIKAGVQKTIDRLKLDDWANKEMRARHFQYYCEGKVDSEYLKKHSPFVWMEADRQNLL